MDENAVGTGLVVGFGTPQRSSQPHPQMNASTRAMMQKSGSTCASLPALILPQNSCMSAIGCIAFQEAIGLGKQFVFNAHCGNVALFQFPDEPLHVVEIAVPVSPSRRIGTFVASDMN